jgi:hypothetical protein
LQPAGVAASSSSFLVRSPSWRKSRFLQVHRSRIHKRSCNMVSRCRGVLQKLIKAEFISDYSRALVLVRTKAIPIRIFAKQPLRLDSSLTSRDHNTATTYCNITLWHLPLNFRHLNPMVALSWSSDNTNSNDTTAILVSLWLCL